MAAIALFLQLNVLPLDAIYEELRSPCCYLDGREIMKIYAEDKSLWLLLSWACVLGMVFSSVGCSGKEKKTESPMEARAPKELKKMALDEIGEFKFLQSEGADVDSFRDSATRLKGIVDVLVGKVPSSNESARLEGSRDSLATALENEAAAAVLSKACLKIEKDLKSMTKL